MTTLHDRIRVVPAYFEPLQQAWSRLRDLKLHFALLLSDRRTAPEIGPGARTLAITEASIDAPTLPIPRPTDHDEYQLPSLPRNAHPPAVVLAS